jgi:hypothetical protein
MADENDEGPSWAMDATQIGKLKRKYKLNHACACGWGPECQKAQVIFTWNKRENDPSDLRGGECIVLKLYASPTDQKAMKWQTAVLSNIGTKIESVKNMWSVPVARHHWTTKQLAYFKNNPSVGVEYAVWKDLIHSLDKQDYYEIQGTGKEKNSSSHSKIDSAIDKNTDLSLLEFSATRRCVSAPPRRHRPLKACGRGRLAILFS